MIETALIAQTSVFALVVAVYLCSRSASMFHPLTYYLIFHCLVFVLRPILVHAYGFDSVWLFMGFWPDADHFVLTLTVGSVGLIAFALGCGLVGRADPDLSRPPDLTFDRVDITAFVIVCLALGPLALYSASLREGGASFDYGVGDVQMERDPVTGQAVYVNTTGYIAEAHSMGLPLTLAIIWVARFRLLSFLPFFIFIGYRAYLGWGRWAMIIGIIGMVLLVLFHMRAKWFRWWHVAAGVPVLYLFHLLGNNRGYFRSLISDGSVPETDRGFIESLDNQDLANFDYLSFILWVVPEQSATYTYFTQYLQVFTEPIPRMIWPDKPIGAPIKWVQLHDYGNFSNLTTSLVGDGWMSAGWIGLLVTMALVGMALGLLHRWFWRKGRHNRYGALLYCTFLPLTLQWFRDGNITIVKFGLFALMPILAWILLTRAMRAVLTYGARNAQPGVMLRRSP